MKNVIHTIIFGKDKFSSLIALAVIMLIALGCTCGKDFDFSNLGKNESNSRTAENTSADNSSSNTTPPTRTTAKPDASTGQVPSDDQLQEMARETVLDFNDAIQSGDFTQFHANVSKPFQKEASPERFKEVFQAFIDAKPDFSEIRSQTADFTDTPVVEREIGYKTLKLNGTYPTTPRNTKFELKYIPEGKEWKLISIRISTK